MQTIKSSEFRRDLQLAIFRKNIAIKIPYVSVFTKHSHKHFGLMKLSLKAVKLPEPAPLFLCHRTDVSVMICWFHSAVAYKLNMTFSLWFPKSKISGDDLEVLAENVRYCLTFYSSSMLFYFIILLICLSRLSVLVSSQLNLCALNQAVTGDMFPVPLLYW